MYVRVHVLYMFGVESVLLSNLNLECEQHGNGLPGKKKKKQTKSIGRATIVNIYQSGLVVGEGTMSKLSLGGLGVWSPRK